MDCLLRSNCRRRWFCSRIRVLSPGSCPQTPKFASLWTPSDIQPSQLFLLWISLLAIFYIHCHSYYSCLPRIKYFKQFSFCRLPQCKSLLASSVVHPLLVLCPHCLNRPFLVHKSAIYRHAFFFLLLRLCQPSIFRPITLLPVGQYSVTRLVQSSGNWLECPWTWTHEDTELMASPLLGVWTTLELVSKLRSSIQH